MGDGGGVGGGGGGVVLVVWYHKIWLNLQTHEHHSSSFTPGRTERVHIKRVGLCSKAVTLGGRTERWWPASPGLPKSRSWSGRPSGWGDRELGRVPHHGLVNPGEWRWVVRLVCCGV